MVAASSELASAIYFFSFVFIITMVVMQMVIAIIFSAYHGLLEQIEDAEELEIGPTLIRKLILGRGPSLKELHEPLLDVAKRALVHRLARPMEVFFKWVRALRANDDASVAPEGKFGKLVTPDTFSDDHLLQLFDPQHVFRFYGILSPKLKEEIVSIKVHVAKEREVESKSQQKIGRKSSSQMSGASFRSFREEQDNIALKDSWALDRQEFCALLNALDGQSGLQVHFAHNNESKDSVGMLIANQIFAAYGRKHENHAEEGQFRKRVAKKLDKILKICEQLRDERDDRVLSGDNSRRVPAVSQQISSEGAHNFSLGRKPSAAASQFMLGRNPSTAASQFMLGRKPSTAVKDYSNVQAVKRNSRHRLSLLATDLEGKMSELL